MWAGSLLFIWMDKKQTKSNGFLKKSNYLAYSCGNGLEYHVSISHWPNSMAAGQRSSAANAMDEELIKFGFRLMVPPWTAKFNRPPFAFIMAATDSALFCCIRLNNTTSFCVTPGANGCFAAIDWNRYEKKKLFILIGYNLFMFRNMYTIFNNTFSTNEVKKNNSNKIHKSKV